MRLSNCADCLAVLDLSFDKAVGSTVGSLYFEISDLGTVLSDQNYCTIVLKECFRNWDSIVCLGLGNEIPEEVGFAVYHSLLVAVSLNVRLCYV